MEEKDMALNVEAGSEEENVFELLAGYVDEEGMVHKEFVLREMIGKDEEAINRSDVKGNTSRAISVLLSRTCLRIGPFTPRTVGGISNWEKLIKSLTTGDQDYMVYCLRKISFGEDLSISHTCPNEDCGRKLTTNISLDELEILPFKGNREIKFSLYKGYKDKKGEVHKDGKIRLPNGLDREILVPIAKNNISKGGTAMLVRVCSFDDGYPVTDDVMSSLTMRDRNYLSEVLNDNLFGIKTTVPVECPDCGTVFEVSLSLINFI